MQINNHKEILNYRTNNATQNKIDKRSNCVNFYGLNQVFSKTIYPSSDLLKSIYGIYKSSIVGNLPGEFVKLIKKDTNICKTELAQNVKVIYEAFGEAGQELNKINQLNRKTFEQLVNTDDKRVLDEYFKFLEESGKNLDCDTIHNLHEGFRKVQWISNETNKSIENTAKQKLVSAFKSSGILKKDDNIELEFIGEGLFGRCYKISATDTDGKQIFSDKVLKVYKDISLEKDFILNSFVAKLHINTKNEKEINQYLNKKIKEQPHLKYFYNKFKPSSIVYDCPEEIQKQDIKFSTEDQMNRFKDFHGIYPEANASAYISKAIGHDLSNSDITKQYCFDLKNNISLSEFADDYVTRKNNLESIGVKCHDGNKPGNTIKEKLVDMGGFTAEDKNLTQNPIVRRINKKIEHTTELNDRINLWNKYYNQVKENKIANRHDVAQGLLKALDNIPLNHLNKLDIYLSEIRYLRPDLYNKLYASSEIHYGMI